MGREVRRVPTNWQHPRTECKHSPWGGGCSEAKANDGMCCQPLYDRDFETAAEEWKAGFAAWERGERPEYCSEESRSLEFWEWDGRPPNRDYYRPKWNEEDRTWVQVYETVSEGTPVTPAFATKAELIDYLVEFGDEWDQSRGDGGWSRENATQFVERGWACSLMVLNAPGKPTEVFGPRDGMPEKRTPEMSTP